MWDSRQVRHQQPAASCGNGTAAGSVVHQHAPGVLSAIAQEKAAPQRVHLLIGMGAAPGRIQAVGMHRGWSYRLTLAEQTVKFNNTAI